MATPGRPGAATGRPDFLIMGAPKAGSTALHAALAQHPQLWGSVPKEPKYFLCDGRPPPRSEHRGPGDAHSSREWIWERPAYQRLFEPAPAGALTFESTPFYLWDRAAHRRIAQELPTVKLIAVIRDPMDRAFSNWTHLWADGLEPEASFADACAREPQRAAAGWAPFWRYRELGLYGAQLAHLFQHVDRDRVRVIRYRALVDAPTATLDALCAFLGVEPGPIASIPAANLGRWASPGALNQTLRRVIRAGAAAGSHLPPRVWRTAEKPLLGALQRGSAPRALLSAEDRAALVPYFTDDVAQLSALLGEDYSDWLAPSGRGTYTVRRS